jgi:glyoxylase-like metal-dependent hydrolase (beta-lactamase superfamily II)
VLADHQGFGAFLAAKGLTLDAGRLEPAGRWVTPDFSPLRFDARFFTARLPEGEEASVWPGELSAGEFVAPSRALSMWERGDVLLHPPNWLGMHCLERAAPPEALPMLRTPQASVRIQFQKGIWLEALRTPTLPPAAHTNCWVVDLGEGVAVVDPGSPWPEEQARLDRFLDGLAAEGRPAREVWLTHHHGDHVGGVARLAGRGLPVLAHPLTAARLGLAARPVREGDLLHGRWRALHTPGHAPGHLAFHDERSGALLAGDMVSTLSTVIVDPPEGDMAEYLRQLERLRALRPRTLYPGHGVPAPNGPAKLDEYLAHRRAREEKVLAALDRGGTLAEVTRLAYDDTPAAMLPAAERSCLASLEKLRAEGRVRLEGGRWSAAR